MMINMKNKLTFIDLFSGCGGLSEGFYMNDFKCLLHLDNDHFSCETLRERMKYYKFSDNEINILEKNITDNDVIHEIDKIINNSIVDVIVGGPPCQSYSSLGKAKDKYSMKNDPRNFLFVNYLKILNHFKPKIFVFENVLGLLSAKIENENTFDIIAKGLNKKYNLLNDPKSIILNSADYGVPQIRKRVILIGVRKDLDLDVKDVYKNIKKTHFDKESINKKFDNYVTVRDAIADLPSIKPGEGDSKIEHKVSKPNKYLKLMKSKKDKYLYDHVARNHNKDDRARFREMSKNNWTFKDLLINKPSLGHKKKRLFGNSYVVQNFDKPSKTIIAHLYKDGNQFIHPDYTQERSLTVREAARLQSFPDNFRFMGSRTQQYKQVGNAVPPLMSNAIAKSINKCIFELKND